MKTKTFALAAGLSAWLACTGGMAPGSAMAQESSVPALQSAAKAAPGDPTAALALGRGLRRAGKTLQALAELRRGLGLSFAKPELLVPLHWELARTLEDRRDYPGLMTECHVLGMLPGSAPAGHACTAYAHLLWQRSTEALAETALALAKQPTSLPARLAEGRAHELALDAAHAEASSREALKLQPDDVDAHVALGRLLVKDGRKDEGLAELRKAVALDADGPEALYELGLALAPSAESMSVLEHATRERPPFAPAWLALGDQQLAAGRLAEARKAGDEALRADATAAAPLLLLGKVALAEHRPDDAIKAGEAVLRTVPNSAPGKLLVADGQAQKGEVDLALEAYQAAWGLDHQDPTPLVHAAEACHAAGRDTSARAFASKAAQEFPKWGPAWAALGDALAAQNEKAPAKDAYQKALAADGPVDRAAVQKKLSAL